MKYLSSLPDTAMPPVSKVGTGRTVFLTPYFSDLEPDYSVLKGGELEVTTGLEPVQNGFAISIPALSASLRSTRKQAQITDITKQRLISRSAGENAQMPSNARGFGLGATTMPPLRDRVFMLTSGNALCFCGAPLDGNGVCWRCAEPGAA